ncbi:hypothetical protein A3B42_05230 [Candidatus Daviesbacteria bacterium RIFCSPLOWO2_01_FULL_38_10]|uniref:Uncharacterized protein n=1 Tax=Candidatus Daviesbacteria bacterium GW2011_GWF2_38_6 TaxID=1618432 RepID=A0A0G0KET6_9BACT|nr:MAG: hypothetical protein US80_C0011G0003 [Candidatus Daviesbacteria bacterium GW2011_GWA2_38_17]KKQ78108.1 MAG: hypothetical protein US99_C0029G0002 [Candidatus Daviesbacteria bacterium GW2011_GWF2_38_6]OGE28000.1 MAG: hypothetical protein A3D02_04520 [Candidatus Daviesbacteria bacterium RIFCSPHIGHO2_02_FULL_39_41]OGE38644.1 MAG: hypothetical protein A3B42_05230 [Candidatus Daviesbacteria bacterium RIFCSPLOWO2_01_FULL_38_10]OGE44262.1 MAG: hypothetical protein A3E67_04560 [Candidatus Davies
MVLDKKLAKLLSEISLDLSKAWLIGILVTPVLSGNFLNILVLTVGLINAIVFLVISRMFLERADKHEL